MSLVCHCQPAPGYGPCTCSSKCKQCQIDRNAAREWRKITDDHAVQMMRGAIMTCRADLSVCLADDQGGLVAQIRGPDGEWRRYFVRLTEVRP